MFECLLIKVLEENTGLFYRAEIVAEHEPGACYAYSYEKWSKGSLLL